MKAIVVIVIAFFLLKGFYDLVFDIFMGRKK